MNTQAYIKALRYFERQQYSEARQVLDGILADTPEHRESRHLLGCICLATGRYEEALDHLHATGTVKDPQPSHLFNYGLALYKTGRYAEALKAFNTVLSMAPAHIPSLTFCGIILCLMGELTGAEKCCRFILAHAPRSAEALNNLGNILKEQGAIEEAIRCYEKALHVQPGYAIAGSSLLLCLCYANRAIRDIFNAHVQWEKRLTSGMKGGAKRKRPMPADGKPLAVGYLSPDFRTHSVAYFIESILKHHDYTTFSIYCYADVVLPDGCTQRLTSYPCRWNFVKHLSDASLIERIRHDHIDILVDLAGHSGENRLPIFLEKPAPLQVTYLGYPNTTGLSTMDYRFTDAIADPEGSDRYYTEKLFRLPDSFLCYTPPPDFPAIEEPPRHVKNHITFGSFNTLPKINDEVLETWGLILSEARASTLLLKTKQFNDDAVRQKFAARCRKQGIDTERLRLAGYSSSVKEHLSLYNQIDIALDTFPYNGTTTTCEALLMGVPVLCMRGDRHAGRVGDSILTGCSLKDFVAADKESYVKKAVALSRDANALSFNKHSIRDTFLHSPLCDGRKFTRNIEQAYREMWKRVVSSE